MTWFKIDDKFHASKEVKSIPREQRVAAVGLWALAGAWCSDQLNDGFVPAFMVEDLAGSTELADLLVAPAKLWVKRKDGYQFRNWAKWQQTREEVESKRTEGRNRIAAYRARKKAENHEVGNADVTRYKSEQESYDPSTYVNVTSTPTRPDPTLVTTPNGVVTNTHGGKPPRGTRLPEPFIVTGDMRSWAAYEVPTVDVDAATRSFVDYWRGRAGPGASKVDWIATWRNSLRSASERQAVGRPQRLSAAEKNLAGLAAFAAQERAVKEITP